MEWFGIAGLEAVVVLPFTLELARLSPEDFVVEILVRNLHVRAVLVNRFVDLCLGKDVENCADATIGPRSVEVVEAMLRSAKSGRVETTGEEGER